MSNLLTINPFCIKTFKRILIKQIYNKGISKEQDKL